MSAGLLHSHRQIARHELTIMNFLRKSSMGQLALHTGASPVLLHTVAARARAEASSLGWGMAFSRQSFGGSNGRSELWSSGTQRNFVVHAVQDDGRRHAIITGANSGIGKATAMELARKGMTITLACKNEAKGKAVAEEIAHATDNTFVRAMTMDLNSLQSVRDFVADYKDMGYPLHVLVNNAGIMACPQAYTEDGFEKQLGVNHLGHFLLTALLMDKLIASSSTGQMSRVVVLASAAEAIGNLDFEDLNFKRTRGYNSWTAYGQSKLANCLFSYELARRTEELGLPIISNSMHPGIVNTMLIRYVVPGIGSIGNSNSPISRFASGLFRLFGLRSPEEGASTAVFLASSPEVENSSGLYYTDSRESRPSRNATNPALASRLWDVSVELTGASQALEPVGLSRNSMTIS